MPFWRRKEKRDKRPVTLSPTWGDFFDKAIETEGMENFKEEYSQELVKAYESGLLHLIPQSLSDEIPSMPQMTFIDRRNQDEKGNYLQSGSMKGTSSISVDDREFFLRCFPHLDQKRVKEVPRLTAKFARLVISTVLGNLTYTIMKYATEEYAQNFIELMESSSKRTLKTFVNLFPATGFRIRMDEVLSFTKFEGMNILIKRLPAETQFEYSMWWQHGNFVFNIFGVDKDFRLEKQSLKEAVGKIDESELFEKSIQLLTTHHQNRHRIVSHVSEFEQIMADAGYKFGRRDYKEALKIYRKALRLEPANALVHSRIGVTKIALNDHEDAERELKRAIQLDPKDDVVHCNLGFLYNKLNRHRDAERELAEAVRLKPNLVNRYSHAVILSNIGQIDEARAELEEVFKIDPNYEPAFTTLNNLLKLSASKRFPPEVDSANQDLFLFAEKICQKAIGEKPKQQVAHRCLGYVLTGLGRKKEARTQFEEAIELNPRDAASRDYLEYLIQEIESDKEPHY